MKNIFIFCILFLKISLLFSQNWQQRIDKYNNAIVAGNYSEAIKTAEEALVYVEKEYSIKSKYYEKSLRMLSESHHKAGNLDSTIYFTDLILKYNISVLSDTLPDFASILGNTCSMFRYYMDKEQGISNLNKAIEVIKSVKSVDYSVINKLTNIYTSSYQKTEAKDTVSELESIRIKSGTNSLEYLNALEKEVLDIKQKYQYQKMIISLTELINIKQQLKGEKDTTLGGNLFDLANAYFYTMNYDSAGIFFKRAVEYWKRNKGTGNPNYGMAHYNYAVSSYTSIWMKQGGKPDGYNFQDETDILNSFIEAEPLLLKHFGKSNPYYSATTLYIASIYMRKDNLTESEKYYQKNLDSSNDPTDTMGYKKTAALWGLGAIHVRNKKLDKAEPIFSQLNNLTFNQIRSMLEYVAVPSEKKVSQYFVGYNYNLNWYYSYFYERYRQNPRVSETIYDNELAKKGLILRVMKHKISAILNSGDTGLVSSLNQWLQFRQQVAKLYLLPVSERKINVNYFEKKMQDIEGNMYYKTWLIRDKLRAPIVSWKNVQDKLSGDEAAIEFVSFDYLSWGNSWMADSVIYFALINRKGYDSPKLIPLFDSKVIETFIKSLPHENDYQYVASMYGSDSLYKLIWKPLEKELIGVKNIYYSPSSVLHKISFPALVDENGVLLADKYNLHRLTTTAYLVENKEPLKFKPEYEALFYGGILYDLDSNSIEYYAKKFKKESPDFFIRDRSFEWSDSLRGGTYWSYLEGTLQEANKVSDIVKAKLKKTTVLSSKDAVEESIKGITQSPDILHIATHGFFFPEMKTKKKEPNAVADESTDPTIVFRNPLLRSGLVFAGANHVWTGNPPAKGVEDGILTAYEVSTLNLMNTKIVILSACETGLGEIKGSEGVYGLQRAFKQAGVEYIIMSLWQIPDEQTVELMEFFYKKWVSGADVRTAFTYAQSEMRKKYNPYYWAAFVLLE